MRVDGRADGVSRGRGGGGRGEAVAEVAGGGRGGVGVLLQAPPGQAGIVAVHGAVVQVVGGQGGRGAAELGLEDQAWLEHGLGVDILLGQPTGGGEPRVTEVIT